MCGQRQPLLIDGVGQWVGGGQTRNEEEVETGALAYLPCLYLFSFLATWTRAGQPMPSMSAKLRCLPRQRPEGRLVCERHGAFGGGGGGRAENILPYHHEEEEGARARAQGRLPHWPRRRTPGDLKHVPGCPRGGGVGGACGWGRAIGVGGGGRPRRRASVIMMEEIGESSCRRGARQHAHPPHSHTHTTDPPWKSSPCHWGDGKSSAGAAAWVGTRK